MDIRKTFSTNKTKEVQGVWVDGPDGSKYLIARQGNKAFTDMAAELTKPYRRLIEMGKIDSSLMSEIAAEVTSRTVLLGWQDVTDEGKLVPYSHETAKRYLLEMSDFADMIAGFSRSIALFQDGEKKAAEGN